MRLQELLTSLPVRVVGPLENDVLAIEEDSRRVVPGALFVARAGSKVDGTAYVHEAIARGAAAVLSEREPLAGEQRSLPWIVCESPAAIGAILADRLAGVPSSRLQVAGVTGTNGKTTISWLIARLLEGLGVRCGLVGTVVIEDGATSRPSDMTTPPPARLASLMRDMVGNGCGAMSMEVSSHALDQRRVAAIPFAVGIFSNLSGDHLDYHGTMDNYAAAKARLFEQIRPGGLAIIEEGPYASVMREACAARGVRVVSTGAGGQERARVLARSLRGMELEIRGRTVRTGLIGDFNASNLMQALLAAEAIAARLGMGDCWAKLLPLCEHLAAPPGRLERVSGPDAPFAVFVDYAHSDDSLERVLASVRACVAGEGSVLCVFGCGGDRDRSKRPRMGRVASAGADVVIVTSDNPRTEDPMAIIEQVLGGIAGRSRVRTEVDRRLAIAQALREAREGDIVVIAGKGHERTQTLPDGAGGVVSVPFDDREVARSLLAEAGILSDVAGG